MKRRCMLATLACLLSVWACNEESPLGVGHRRPTVSSGAHKAILAHITGGGQVDDATFSLEALSSAIQKTVTGGCTINAPKVGLEVRCLDVQVLADSDDALLNTAWMAGCASVSGTLTPYRIDVSDLAEPGDGIDFFSFSSALFTLKGTVTNGNITIHKSAENGDPRAPSIVC